MQDRTRKIGAGKILLIVLIVVGAASAIYFFRANRITDHSKPTANTSSNNRRAEATVLELSEETAKSMGLKTTTVTIPQFSRKLRLRGSLAIDPNRMSHVHARFPGQVVELATVKGMQSMQSLPIIPPARALQNFDEVKQGAPMAIIWSKDQGEKKSELWESLIKLHTNKITLNKLKTLSKDGGIANRELREKNLEVEQGEIAVFTAEATLRAYQVSEEEIEQIKTTAKKMRIQDSGEKESQVLDKAYSADWPRVIVTAPISGVIVDKGVSSNEIVDANASLFKIADLTVLTVWLHLYEEDLPALEELAKPLKAQLKVPAHPEIGELEAEMDRFSPMIDPNEHMALLIGTVKNPDRKLLANQFVTAEIGLPAEPGVVQIPTKAVIDFGAEAIVFVQRPGSKPTFDRRRVKIVHRYFDFVQIRSTLTDEQKSQGLNEVHEGESVIVGGILELDDYLQQQ